MRSHGKKCRPRISRALALARHFAQPGHMASRGFMIAFAIFDSATIALSSNARGYSPASPLDAFLLLFYGEPEHAPSSRFYVTVPITWLMGQVLFFAFIACALFWATGGRGRQFLLRAGSSRTWWSSLYLAVLAMTLARFLISLAVCAAFPAVSHLLRIEPGTGELSPIDSLEFSAQAALYMALSVLLPQILLTQFLAFLSLYMGAFWSFACVAAFSALSAIAPGTLLFGDWSMLARNAICCSGGLSPVAIEAFSVLLCALLWAIGALRVTSRVELM